MKFLEVSYNNDKKITIIENTRLMPGIYEVKAWINKGKLTVGDNIMYVMVGGHIREHVQNALEYFLNAIKSECISEIEIF